MANRKRFNPPVEFDFATGECVETFDARLMNAVQRIRGAKNPYVGNKRRAIFHIIKHLEQMGVKYDRMIDLFSGGCSVSLIMKLLGKQVIANDLLASAHVYASAFVENNRWVITPEEGEWLMFEENGDSDDFTSRFYSERFTPQEAKTLDRFYANVKGCYYQFPTAENLQKAAVALANMQIYILDHCFVGGRMSDRQVLSHTKHRLSHIRNRGGEMAFRDIFWHQFNTPQNKHQNKAFNMDAIEFLKKVSAEMGSAPMYDMVYIDPPYGGLTSKYAELYQYFEGFIARKPWTELDYLRNGDKFASQEGYESHFVELVREANFVPTMVVSYNDSSWADIGKITNLISRVRKNVRVAEIEYEYNYREHGKKKATEYLIVAQ